MSHPVHDGEAIAHERNVFVTRNVLAIGVADQHVHRLLLDPLMQQVHIGLCTRADLRIGQILAQHFPDADVELRSLRAGDRVGVPVTMYTGFMSSRFKNSVSETSWSGSPKIATRLPARY